MRPQHVFGMIAPQPDNPFMYYQFYRVFPPESLFVQSSLGIRSFDQAGVDEALESVWTTFEFLLGFDVQQLAWGGVPLSAIAGRARMLAMLEEARGRCRVAVSTDFEDTIEAARALGVGRVAVAAKWAPEVMERTAGYLEDAGLEVVTRVGEAHTPQEVHELNVDDGIRIALELGRRAFASAPNADALMLLGGAWLVTDAVLQLEATFGKPVITNPTALFWGTLRRAGLRARPGYGRLLETTAKTEGVA